MKSIVLFGIFCISTAAFAKPTVTVELTLEEIKGNTMTDAALCSATASYDIIDARKDDNNGVPDLVIKNCAATYNGKTLNTNGWIGVGIYDATGRNDQTESQKSYEVALTIGDQNYTNWSTTFDLAPKDHNVRFQFPVPPAFRVEGADQFLILDVNYREEGL